MLTNNKRKVYKRIMDGKEIYNMRIKLGLSQGELAKEMHLHMNQIHRHENDKIKSALAKSKFENNLIKNVLEPRGLSVDDFKLTMGVVNELE